MVVESFCDLLSYYEMTVRMIPDRQNNSTSNNDSTATTEGRVEDETRVEILTHLQTLLKENLKDTCNFVSIIL